MRYYNNQKGSFIQAMSYEDAYDYYWRLYESGMFSLLQLQIKHRKGEEARSAWEKHKKKGVHEARDYESYANMQKALRRVIREIHWSKLHLSPVPQSIDELDLEMEKKKIAIADRTLLSSAKKNWVGDSFYHNIRAYLINRVEQASDYKLIVRIDGDKVEIQDRKEYLLEATGSCQSCLCMTCEDACEMRKRN